MMLWIYFSTLEVLFTAVAALATIVDQGQTVRNMKSDLRFTLSSLLKYYYKSNIETANV